MASVDDRVVNMVFNNAAFEQKIAGTMLSLDKLNKSLAFPSGSKGMADISTAASGFHMGGMTAAIEGVSGKFLAMSTIAITALATVVTHAVSAGINLAKSLSLDQVIGGFKEYETNMNSIQTIMANTSADATTLEDVNGALAVLNEYSDQTIYNFGEMARNIGTFTAAGVDLDTSTNAIKGIANLAAISGSNSQQASTAMYQLSQAMASGSVKLMDWNSIVNAGMGGEIFQKALFETGKSLGTIADVPIDMTFEEWTAAGNTFRGSLESGWLSAEVLTNTLQGFTGDLDKAQLMALGYTDAQATEMMRLGAVGKAAATEVKTLTQLIGTVKESVGSGWSKSFGIIIGDFDEAKALFTDINSAIGNFVGKNADARNSILEGWKELGGRTTLIEGFKSVFTGLGSIIAPIREAFHEFFPPMTIANLVAFTHSFKELAERLEIGSGTAIRIKQIFRGLFAAVEIGWTIIKELGNSIRNLFSGIGEGDSTRVLTFFVNLANRIIALNDSLVAGGGIADFFARIVEVIKEPIPFLEDLRDRILRFFLGADLSDGITPFVEGVKQTIKDFFSGAEYPDFVSALIEKFQARWSGLYNAIKKVADFVRNTLSSAWNAFTSVIDKVGDALSPVFDAIKLWFTQLGTKLAEVMGPGDFDAVLDALNVSLLGGILLLLRKFLDDGIKLDIGGGLFGTLKDSAKGIGRSFDTLTGTLKAMQTEIKADALLKIAAAIALLTGSVVVLSLIDSAALTKALAAMSIGFGQLVGVMTLMSKASMGPMGAVQVSIMAGAMILMAGAMVILALAMKIFGTMSWEELAKGFAGVGVGLGLIAAGMQLMPGGVQMILQSTALILIGTALTILAGAVALFGLMEWDTMAKGFGAVGVGLGLIAGAMHLMPGGIQMILQSAGLVLIGIALNAIAASMLIFATMSWEDLAKGLVGVGGGLLVIAGAMNLMPGGVQMVLQAAALVLVGIALNAIAGAMLIFGTMSWEEIGKGLAAMAGALIILAAATNAMSGAILGAVAITLVSIAMGLLVAVMKEFIKMSWSELAKGLAGLAAVLITLGLTALVIQPMIPALLGLAAAMLLLGVGFALFGLGAQAVAKAFEIIAKSGKVGVETIIFFIDQLIVRIPALIGSFANGLKDLALIFLKAAPVLIKALGVVIEHIIETLIKLIPKFVELGIELIAAFLKVLRESIPDFIETGLTILVALLTGIRDNIAEITTLVVEIILGFIGALTAQLPAIVTAAITLLTTFVSAIADNIGQVVTAGLGIIVSLLDGIAQNIGLVIAAAVGLITSFITEIAKGYLQILAAGTQMILEFIKGITAAIADIVVAAIGIIAEFIGAIGDGVDLLITAGKQLIIDFIIGIGTAATDIAAAAVDTIVKFLAGITSGTSDIIIAGKDLIISFLRGMENAAEEIIVAAVDLVIAFMQAVSDNANRMVNAAFDILIGFINGMTVAVTVKGAELREAGWNLAMAIADGMSGGLASRSAGLVEQAAGLGRALLSGLGGALLSDSPSRATEELGEFFVEGFAIGLNNDMSVVNSAENIGHRVIRTLQETLSKIPSITDSMTDLNPIITPVLDLTQVIGEARKLGDILGPLPVLALGLSTKQARAISVSTGLAREELESANRSTGPTEFKFEQNNYSPEALSTSDIYRQTRNQIALAKEELAVL